MPAKLFCFALMTTLIVACDPVTHSGDTNDDPVATTAADPRGITGRWQGAIDIGGQQLELAIGLKDDAGDLDGQMDIQGMKGLTLEAISFEAPAVHFEFPHPSGTATFSGALSGGVISGTFEQSGSQGTFSLTRVEPADISPAILAHMDKEHIPGVAAAIVRGGRVAWTGTWGYADLDKQAPVTADTIFQLASVSKTITSTALMQLYAQGKFALNDDVSGFLPFAVRNPNFPDEPVTFAQLLQHRSSIRDDMAFYGPLWGEAHGDTETPLGEFLQSYLSENGAQFSPEENFFDYPPGGDFNYCNTCYALLGYLAERIAGQPFEEYTRQALFDPLSMTDAAWFHRDVKSEMLAQQYRYDPESGFEAYGVVGYPDWPAGLLRMSVTELATFLAAYTSAGDSATKGAGVIDPVVVNTMAPDHQALGYYTWFVSSLESTADVLYSHGGGDLGARTEMGFNPKTGEGIVILTNGEGNVMPLAAIVYKALPTLGWEP